MGRIGHLEMLGLPLMSAFQKNVLLALIVAASVAMGGCVSCLPQYVAPPEGPVSACYPTGHDPYIPMDHNPALINPWDLMSSVAAPFIYGPPR
ncbi:MAG: hypothetical protein P8182_14900 [Deltaproteobacteria bacterium]